MIEFKKIIKSRMTVVIIFLFIGTCTYLNFQKVCAVNVDVMEKRLEQIKQSCDSDSGILIDDTLEKYRKKFFVIMNNRVNCVLLKSVQIRDCLRYALICQEFRDMFKICRECIELQCFENGLEDFFVRFFENILSVILDRTPYEKKYDQLIVPEFYRLNILI